MNEQIINDLLKQLRSNLESVESARQQVEETIGAYSALEDQVHGFVGELGLISQNTRIIIDQLEESKESFLTNVTTNLEKKIDDGVTSIISKAVATKNEILQHGNEIKLDINRSNEDLSTKITAESAALLNKIENVKNTIISDIQNTGNNAINALSCSEQRILQQVEERGNAIQENVNESSSSIKKIVYGTIGLSIVTLCLVIYILIKFL